MELIKTVYYCARETDSPLDERERSAKPVKTGDRNTEVGVGGTRSDENVVRFPRDWVGPLEELLPIGPMPKRPASSPADDTGLPPSADTFWSEDSAVLHDAVTGPDGVGVIDPADPPTVAWSAPRRRRPRPRLLRPLASAAARIARTHVMAGAGVLAVVALLAMAVIGFAETGSPTHTAAHSGVHTTAGANPRIIDTGVRPAPQRVERTVRTRHRAGHHHGVRAHARARTRHRTRRSHHPAAASLVSPSAPAPETTSTPTTTTPASAQGASQGGAVSGSGPTTVNSHPVSTPPPAQPAFGQQGTLGPGSSSDS